jgi:hypothetical protein
LKEEEKAMVIYTLTIPDDVYRELVKILGEWDPDDPKRPESLQELLNRGIDWELIWPELFRELGGNHPGKRPKKRTR